MITDKEINPKKMVCKQKTSTAVIIAKKSEDFAGNKKLGNFFGIQQFLPIFAEQKDKNELEDFEGNKKFGNFFGIQQILPIFAVLQFVE